VQEKEYTYEELKTMVTVLLKKVEELQAELAFYKTPKNSNNSSIPPSKDENRIKRTQSLREKSNKKTGGQLGHEGSTLKMAAIPDEIIKHIPDFCNDCGKDISSVEAILQSTRQVVDIPPIVPIYRQHETYSRKCSCGKLCQGNFPFYLKGTIQYGPGVETMVAYLSVRQYMPYRRMSEFFNNVLNLPISEGSVENLLERFKHKVYPAYQLIKTQIEHASVVGSDETGVKINGKKGWIWTWQNSLNTFLSVSFNRGKQTIEQLFDHGFIKAVLVSDAWAAQLSTLCIKHQMCIAHLLREINFLIELYPQNDWIKNLKILLKTSIDLKHAMFQEDYNHSAKRDEIEKRLEELLKIPPDPINKKVIPLHKRLVKHRNSIFTFLYYSNVPPDNNQSERSIRNVKIKQKVSGQFKSIKGAQTFVIIRSVIDTLIKRKLNIFLSLNKLAILDPE
jgi:transposase